MRYRSAVRHEFDLDAALRRRPEIILVDELAHSNLVEGEPRPRHAKRWQDIEELLDAGINVWTTVNVQHLESLNDLVAQITGVRQRETIPDHVFDEADEVELIDLPPDDLLARLKAGKVYHPEQAGVAAERFFRKGNLLALREIALRRTADRVDAAARAALATEYGTRPWLARDRLLVAVGPDLQAEQLVRAGKRLADALDAQWTVVYVETPELLRLPEAERNRRIDLLRLAESLGAETVTLDGPRAAGTLIEYARTRKASRVLVGCAKAPRLARVAAPVDCHRARAPRTRLRRDHAVDSRAAGARASARRRRVCRHAAAGQLDALCEGPGRDRDLHRSRFRDVPVFRAHQYRHGVHARRRGSRAAPRPRPGNAGGDCEHPGAQFLLRAAAIHVRRSATRSTWSRSRSC